MPLYLALLDIFSLLDCYVSLAEISQKRCSVLIASYEVANKLDLSYHCTHFEDLIKMCFSDFSIVKLLFFPLSLKFLWLSIS